MNRFKLFGAGMIALVLLGGGCAAGTGSEIFSIVDKDPSAEATLGGFYEDVQKVRGVQTTVRPTDIRHSGQSETTFPSVDEVNFISVSEAESQDYLFDELTGYAVMTDAGSRFYPTQLLAWHGPVHDEVNGEPVVVTHSPLSGTGGVFVREEGETFGLSGYVWNNDALFYDDTTESLWSILRGESIYGKRAGDALLRVPFSVMSWSTWKSAYPDGQVLSSDLGYVRSYNRSPYGTYMLSNSILFDLTHEYSPALFSKAVISGVAVNGQAKAYQEGPLVQVTGGVLNDTLGDNPVVAWVDAQQVVRVHDGVDGLNFSSVGGDGLVDEQGETWTLSADGALVNGEQVLLSHQTTNTYWFSWNAMYPETELYAYVSNKGLVNGTFDLEDGQGIIPDDGTTHIEVGDGLQVELDTVE